MAKVPDIKREYVVGFLFTTNLNQMSLIHKLKPAWQKGKYNGIGGKIEKGETPAEAMRREFEEEAGLDIDTWRQFFVLRDKLGSKIYFFEARSDELTESMTMEKISAHAVSIIGARMYFNGMNEIQLIPNLRWLIPLALDKDSVRGSGEEPIELKTVTPEEL